MYERIAPLVHDSLDNVPEPSETLSLAGHAEAWATLISAHQNDKLHHAVLFAGPQGIGKATLAFRFAAYLLGEDFGTGPRNPSSAIYRQIASGAHPGLLHLTRPFDEKLKKFRTVITADEIRKVSRFLSLRTHDGGYRVVIVDPADDMNRSAANALLKSLEEPPSKVIFILISHSVGRLLPTIRSRAQTIKLQPLAVTELLQAMSAFEVPLLDTEEARQDLMQRASGSVRSALLLTTYGGLDIASALDSLIGTGKEDVAQAYKLADAISARDAGIQFQLFNTDILERLSGTAHALAEQGQTATAARIANAWEKANKHIGETEAFNLDKKQHVLNMLHLVRSELSAVAS